MPRLELDLEAPRGVGSERDPRRLAPSDVFHQVVAVNVDFVGDIGPDNEDDAVTGGELRPSGTRDFATLDGDLHRCRAPRLGRCGRFRAVAGLGSGRSRLRRGCGLVVWSQKNEQHDRDGYSCSREPEFCQGGHAGSKTEPAQPCARSPCLSGLMESERHTLTARDRMRCLRETPPRSDSHRCPPRGPLESQGSPCLRCRAFSSGSRATPRLTPDR
jgi:hypothetical protein